jgi:hypothetical protein
MRQLVQRHAQDEDGQDAEGDRHRIGPQHIGGRSVTSCAWIGQMRREQPAAGAATSAATTGSSHTAVMPSRLCSWRVNMKYGISTPQAAPWRRRSTTRLRDRHDAFAEARDAEGEAAVDDRGEAHRDGADEHRHGVVPEDAPRLVPEQDPARA